MGLDFPEESNNGKERVSAKDRISPLKSQNQALTSKGKAGLWSHTILYSVDF